MSREGCAGVAQFCKWIDGQNACQSIPFGLLTVEMVSQVVAGKGR